MSEESTLAAAKFAAAAAAMGALGRVALALHGGARGLRLATEGLVGAMLGIVAAGIALYFDVSLREQGWPLLIVSSVAGLAGAMGTRALDLLEAAIRRRIG
jgi:hypothetical protein